MTRSQLISGLAVTLVLACGGTDNSLIGDGGGDGNTGSDGNNQNDGTTEGSVNDSGPPVSCDGGLIACANQCVDTSSDPNNCGGCGVVCNTQCNKGICQLITASDAGPPQNVGDFACLNIDSTNVYWGTGLSTNTGGGVWKVALGGGTPTLVIGLQDRPHALASDGTNVFFANYGTGANIGSIQRIAINGTVATPIAIAQASPMDLVIDANNVYWANSGDGSIWKSDKTTPNPIKLAGPLGANHAANLRVDATNVYWTDPSSGVVNRTPIATGATVSVSNPANQIPNVRQIAIDTQNAYVGSSQNQGAAILSMASGGTNGSTNQIMPNLKSIQGIQTDGTFVWYAMPTTVTPYQPNHGEIHRMTTAGQNDTPLATGQNAPGCIAVDSTSVYWINLGNGMISKTGK